MSEYICVWQDYSICYMVNRLQCEESDCEDYLLKKSTWKMVVYQGGDGDGEAHLGGRKICWRHMWNKKITGCFMYEQQSVAGTSLSHCDLTELILLFFFSKLFFLLSFGFAFWRHHALLDSCLFLHSLSYFVTKLCDFGRLLKCPLKLPCLRATSMLDAASCLAQTAAVQYFCPLALLTLLVLCSTRICNIETSI